MFESGRLTIDDLLLEGPTVTLEDGVMTWTGRELVIECIANPTQKNG
jgi:hypothetical protein